MKISSEDQTLVLYSGHPLGLFPSAPSAPRAIITNGMVIPNYSSRWFICKIILMINVVKYDDMDDKYDDMDDDDDWDDQGRVRPDVCTWSLDVRPDDGWKLLLYWTTGHH